MVAYLIRRVAQMIVVLFFAALATYLILSLATTGVLSSGESQHRTTAQEIALRQRQI